MEIVLNNGMKIPALGIGTYRVKPDDCERTVTAALKAGYRLVDTANVYLNERAVGRALKASGVPRGEVIVTSKLWPTDYKEAKAEKAIDATLARLGIDYIDLLLLHQEYGDGESAWKAMERAVDSGKVRALGVSNFGPPRLTAFLKACRIKPVVNQVECHPYFQETALRTLMDEHGIKLESWFPLGSGNRGLLQEPILAAMAEKYHKSTVQIVIRWHLQEGFIVIPGTKSPDHARENLNVFDFELTDEEMDGIRKLDKNTPFFRPFVPLHRFQCMHIPIPFDRQK